VKHKIHSWISWYYPVVVVLFFFCTTSKPPSDERYNPKIAIDSHGKIFRSSCPELNSNRTIVERLDGKTWRRLGPVFNNPIKALAFDKKDVLYVAGGFDSIGNRPSRGLARWDVITWKNFDISSVCPKSNIAQ
jgi:hypothetical protein